MDMNHLHLHVRDVQRSQRFYETWFGFRDHANHEGIVFLRNESAFDLALAPDPAPAPMPTWFHFGFRLDTPATVKALHARMLASGLPGVRPVHAEESYVSFRCQDPDGYGIEVYWE